MHGKKKIMRILCWLGIFGALLLLLPEQADSGSNRLKDEQLELVHADSLRYDRIGDKGVVYFIGNIFFRKGNKKLRCDRAIYYRDREVTVFEGNVVFEDSSRYLSADYVEYHAKPEQEFARGNVLLIVDQKAIYADEVAYLVYREWAEAKGNVRFEDQENGVRLFSENLTYDRNAELGRAVDRPRLVKLDSLDHPEMTIDSHRMDYDGKNKIAVALDSVVIIREDMTAYADTAKYIDPENRIEILGKPVVYQNHDEMRALQMVLLLEDNQLKQARLIGKGSMVSKFLVNGQPAKDQIHGAEIWVDVENDTLRHIRIMGQATSVYHVVDEGVIQGVNQVMGDEMELFFDAGKVTRVAIFSEPGLSRGKFYPLKFTDQQLSWDH